jgi:uncharacterized protein (DUF2147 family)
MKTNILIMIIMIFLTATAHADSDDILGLWNNEEKDAKIEIFHCREKYCGKIFSLTEPNYPEGSKEGVPGTPKLDHNNPDPALRKTPIVGLRIMHDFVYDSDNKWLSGKVYDPENGKTYSGKMILVSPHQLNLRGFIGIPLIGRTAIWTR